MRLVDHEQPHAQPADRGHEPRQRESLGRDVEQPHLALRGALQGVGVRGSAALRVDQLDPPGSDALERGDLILHQRNERRHDEREVVSHQRRQLVAE